MTVELVIMDYFLGPQYIDLTKPCDFLCDIDGTIADNNHRQHWLKSKPRNWAAYEKNMYLDTPVHHIVSAIHILLENDFNPIFCSGRGEQSRQVTGAWLHQHVGISSPLYMRKFKDYRDDAIIKEELLMDIRMDGYEPLFVLDDRQKVVDMWRTKTHLKCIQVDEGNF